MGKNQQYASEHADAAMEQMQKYGIPASVILAQGILESSNGQSELSQLGNNHFGIKATPAWIEGGGLYLIYTDDKPNEKFCSYASVGESYEHHSQFLKENSRYAELFKLSPDDYQGWATGLQKAGYATGETYAASLIKIIEANGLDRYDKQVMSQMRKEEKSADIQSENPRYSFPLDCKEFLLVTSPFGMRPDPLDASKQQMHKGIDIRANNAPVLATETGGKVIAVNEDVKTAGGKSVTIEYSGEKDTKVQVTYMHLESTGVKVGDVVEAGQQVGISGNTGTHTTWAHLHFSVRQVSAEGETRDIDPASYLADIALKGGIQRQVLCNGENLLAKYTPEDVKHENLGVTEPTAGEEHSPEEWMKKLLSSEDAGESLGSDHVMGMIVSVFSSLMALALQLDQTGSREEQMEAATEAVLSKTIDLKDFVSYWDTCLLELKKDSEPCLVVSKDGVSHQQELSHADVANLAGILQSNSLSDADKYEYVSSIINQTLMPMQMTNSYEQNAREGQSQSMHL